VKAVHLYVASKFPPHPWLTQYCIRVLESFSSDVVFFFIPQIVQALRYDAQGKASPHDYWMIYLTFDVTRVYPKVHTRDGIQFTAIRASNHLEYAC
jgi:hypothetical protein